jgi:hypothetical protein
MHLLDTVPGTIVRLEASGPGTVVLRHGDEAGWHRSGGGSEWNKGATATESDLDVGRVIVAQAHAPEAPRGATVRFGHQGIEHTEYRGGVQNVVAFGGPVFAAQGGSVIFHGADGSESRYGVDADAYRAGFLIVEAPAEHVSVVSASAEKQGAEIVIAGMDLDALVLEGVGGKASITGTKIRDLELRPGIRVDFDSFSFGSLPEELQVQYRPSVTVDGQPFANDADDTRGSRSLPEL